ncbi:MAG: flagellar FlbD family protein [Pseudomonadota bacterium]
MVRLSRLNGEELVINLDAIAYLEATPDSVVTLLNGQKLMVRESIDEIIGRAKAYRRSILVGPTVEGET